MVLISIMTERKTAEKDKESQRRREGITAEALFTTAVEWIIICNEEEEKC